MGVQTSSPQVDAEVDRRLQEAQSKFLAKRAPIVANSMGATAVVWSQKRNLASWMGMLERAVDAGGYRRELVIGERWKEWRVPTTFIWGEKDPFDTPQNGERIAAQIPVSARFVHIPDAGHLPWIDEPERVAGEILRALKS